MKRKLIYLTFDFAAVLGEGMCWTQTSTNPEKEQNKTDINKL